MERIAKSLADCPVWVREEVKTYLGNKRPSVDIVVTETPNVGHCPHEHSQIILIAHAANGSRMSKQGAWGGMSINGTREENTMGMGFNTALRHPEQMVLEILRGAWQSVTLYVHPSSVLAQVPKALPAGELSLKESLVLSCFHYISSARKPEALKYITTEEYDAGLDALKTLGYVSPRNSLTILGRNSMSSASPYEFGNKLREEAKR